MVTEKMTRKVLDADKLWGKEEKMREKNWIVHGFWVVEQSNVLFGAICSIMYVCYKRRRLRPTNWIINDSDFKPSEFERRNPSDSKFDVQIRFWLNDNVIYRLKSTNFWLKLMDFHLFLIFFWIFSIKKLVKRLKKMTLMSIKRLKWSNLIENGRI